MTEREILDKQEQTGNQEYYLMLVGSFLHAYGNGVFALARATGYRVHIETVPQELKHTSALYNIIMLRCGNHGH